MDAKHAKLIEQTKATRFKAGQSGNPAGNPRCRLLSKAYSEQLAELYPDDPEGRTWAAVIAAHVAQLALSKNASEALAAAAELTDRTEGKPHVSVGIGRQELEHVSILELFNQYADSPVIGSAAGSPSGNGGQLASGTTGSGGASPDGGGVEG